MYILLTILSEDYSTKVRRQLFFVRHLFVNNLIPHLSLFLLIPVRCPLGLVSFWFALRLPSWLGAKSNNRINAITSTAVLVMLPVLPFGCKLEQAQLAPASGTDNKRTNECRRCSMLYTRTSQLNQTRHAILM